jgi:hypothetical protein
MTVTIKLHTFRVILAGVEEIDDDMANALYEAGCDDAGVGSCDRVVSVEFDREAESLGDAIGSAVKAVQKAGYSIARVEVM